MNVTIQELKQIEEWRATILECHKKCDTLWDPNLMNEQVKIAESAARLFAASYEKNLLANGFPRQNGYFWDDMEMITGEMQKVMKESTFIPESTADQKRQKKKHISRHETCTNKWVAEQFNQYALPLVRGKNENGELIFEKKKGGDRSGIYKVGTCCERTIKSWIKNHPDNSNPEPISGFHAGMLTTPSAIIEAANNWKGYYIKYVVAFFKWRQTNQNAPRENFRFDSKKHVHSNNLEWLFRRLSLK